MSSRALLTTLTLTTIAVPTGILASRNAARNADLRAAGKPPVGLLDFDGEFMGQVLSYKRAAVVEKVRGIGKDVGAFPFPVRERTSTGSC